MSALAISSIGPAQARVAALANDAVAAPVSLEDRLLSAYASAGSETHQAEAAINAIINSPDITHPEVLARLQTQMAQYNVDVTLLNALVRKGVGTVETLLRAS